MSIIIIYILIYVVTFAAVKKLTQWLIYRVNILDWN